MVICNHAALRMWLVFCIRIPANKSPGNSTVLGSIFLFYNFMPDYACIHPKTRFKKLNADSTQCIRELGYLFIE
jgi:hypothetical protein